MITEFASAVSPEGMKRIALRAYAARQPMLFVGPPGIGKSDGIRQTAEELRVDFRDVRAITFDPVDLRGMPRSWSDAHSDLAQRFLKAKQEGSLSVEQLLSYLVEASTIEPTSTKWLAPREFPTEGEGIMIIDELLDAPPLIQAALLGLILDRRLGEYQLPDGWVIFGAGNRAKDRAGAHFLITSLLSRFCKVEVRADWDDWKKWALRNKIRAEIIGYLAFRTPMLMNFDPANMGDNNFACPRTWHILSKMLSADGALEPAEESLMVNGCVGPEAGDEFMKFLRQFRDLPDLDDVLKDPSTFRIDQDNPSLVYAFCTGLAVRASKANGSAIFKIAKQLENDEYSALLVNAAAMHCPDFMTCPGGIEWMENHEYLL